MSEVYVGYEMRAEVDEGRWCFFEPGVEIGVSFSDGLDWEEDGAAESDVRGALEGKVELWG